ncbi:MAG: beta-hydroxyacyl-ACP dehydratase [Planctomycetales bacterium]|nr:beta-hydroxyacyl-ACP dehydratase [Planctomycetales bacterium]
MKNQIIDFGELDFNHVVADIDEIRKYNPQRFEFEQLTAIIFDDAERGICVGYKDIGPDEFWVRGHMPGMPLMPGVMMCEAAAQLCSYHTQRNDLLGAEVVGFGGLEEVRFRGVVQPGSRLVIMGEKVKARPGAMIVSRFQGFVDEAMVVEGKLKGIPLPVGSIPTSA